MISDAEFGWIERQVEDGGFDHLVVATSMPWLLPRALHDIESWNEALCAGSRGRAPRPDRRVAAAGASISSTGRRFGSRSIDWPACSSGSVGASTAARPPATICVLSGDVHHTLHLARPTTRAASSTSRVYQITCSPIHNTIPLPMRLVFHFGWSNTVERDVRAISRCTGVPPLPIHWHHPSGPHFGNQLALLTFDGRQARVRLERAACPRTPAANDRGKRDSERAGDQDPSDPGSSPSRGRRRARPDRPDAALTE